MTRYQTDEEWKAGYPARRRRRARIDFAKGTLQFIAPFALIAVVGAFDPGAFGQIARAAFSHFIMGVPL